MRKHNFLKLKRKQILGIVLPIFILFAFQNCSEPNYKGEGTEQNSLSNGDPYAGIQAKPGTYYLVVDGYRCATQVLPQRFDNIVKELIVSDDGSISIRDVCTDVSIEGDPRLITASPSNENVLHFSGDIYQRQPDGPIPPIDTALFSRQVLAMCHSREMDNFGLQRDYSVYQNLQTKEIEVNIRQNDNQEYNYAAVQSRGSDFIEYIGENSRLRIDTILKESTTKYSGSFAGTADNFSGRGEYLACLLRN